MPVSFGQPIKTGPAQQTPLHLFFPVVPHVLDIVVVFHDVQQLFHSKPSVSGDIEGERGENPTSKVLQYPSIINKQRSSEPTFSLAQG